MKFEIHHFHHLGAEEIKLLQLFKKGTLTVEAKLDRIWEKLRIMNEQETELNEQITDLRGATADGFTSISEAVDKAAQRVIQRLQAKDIDLSDEIGILQEMKSTVRSSAQNAVAQLDQIAQPTAELPPNGGPTDELPTDELPAGVELTDEVPVGFPSDTQPADNLPPNANDVADANQPFDPNADVETETSGFDDQERTPVPHI